MLESENPRMAKPTCPLPIDRSGFEVKVICDSISPSGKRITTITAKYWRAIHSEIMTHRDRARNAASSRAIPFYKATSDGFGTVDNCTYSQILNNGFLPVYIGTEQKGMQSGSELEGANRVAALDIITEMKDFCLLRCYELYKLGVHKSIINRYLEPWSYITTIMTATRWNNFYRLRIHPAAEKHFDLLARMIKAAIDESTPKLLNYGEWHMPFISGSDPDMDLETKKRVSAARCARVSYLTHEGKRDIAADLGLFDRLIHPKKPDGTPDSAIHSSPLENVAEPMIDPKARSGPYQGWRQFRKDFANEDVDS